MSKGELMLHCNAYPITYEELKRLSREHCKPLTPTHCPMPHWFVRDLVVKEVEREGTYEIINEEIGVSHKEKNAFGYLELMLKKPIYEEHEDSTLVYAFKNSNRRDFKATVGLGDKVFICDNLSLVAEWIVGAKHTKNVNNTLSERLYYLNKSLADNGKRLNDLITTLKSHIIGNKLADHLMVECVRKGAITKTKIDKIDKEWRKPSYQYTFNHSSAWALFNAVTHKNKGLNYSDQFSRTMKLYKVFENYFKDENGATRQVWKERI